MVQDSKVWYDFSYDYSLYATTCALLHMSNYLYSWDLQQADKKSSWQIQICSLYAYPKINVWGRRKQQMREKIIQITITVALEVQRRKVLTLAFSPLCVTFTPPGSRQHRGNSPLCTQKMLIFWCTLLVKSSPSEEPSYQADFSVLHKQWRRHQKTNTTPAAAGK